MIRRLSFVLAATLAPLPALAQCQNGDVITVNLLPRPSGGVDYCVPDRVDCPLLITYVQTPVQWKIDSTCDGEYTVKIIGDAWKANITAPLPCDPQHVYQGPVQGNQSLVCSGLTAGKYGYRIAVCRANGKCAFTDPGIWVNRGKILPLEYPWTQTEYDAALAESRTIHYGTEADLQKALQRKTPPKKPEQTPKSPKP